MEVPFVFLQIHLGNFEVALYDLGCRVKSVEEVLFDGVGLLDEPETVEPDIVALGVLHTDFGDQLQFVLYYLHYLLEKFLDTLLCGHWLFRARRRDAARLIF